jgi:Circularly permutated YpsA SLOG family
MLIQVISGGQTGADLGGLIAARACGLRTGGWMPRGFLTLDGPRPDIATVYGLQEHTSPNYPPRTRRNVQQADATLRFARHWSTPGERATLKFLHQYAKPHFDVNVDNPPPPAETAAWLRANRVRIVNVAGNTEHNARGIEAFVTAYLTELFHFLCSASPGRRRAQRAGEPGRVSAGSLGSIKDSRH